MNRWGPTARPAVIGRPPFPGKPRLQAKKQTFNPILESSVCILRYGKNLPDAGSCAISSLPRISDPEPRQVVRNGHDGPASPEPAVQQAPESNGFPQGAHGQKLNKILPTPNTEGIFQVLDANATDRDGAEFSMPWPVASWPPGSPPWERTWRPRSSTSPSSAYTLLPHSLPTSHALAHRRKALSHRLIGGSFPHVGPGARHGRRRLHS